MAKVYQAYIDGSGKGDPNHLILAGFIAPAENWEAFSIEWQKRLDLAGLPYFRMYEIGESRPELAAFFYRVIEDCGITAAISCNVRTDHLRQFYAEAKFPPFITKPEQAKNPYHWAFSSIMSDFMLHQSELGITEPVDFFFDTESEELDALEGWRYFSLSHPELRDVIGETPTFRNDKKVLPLQAADLYAWWVRKWVLQDKNPAKHKLPWGEKREIYKMHIQLARDGFWREHKQMLDPDFSAQRFIDAGRPEFIEMLREWHKQQGN